MANLFRCGAQAGQKIYSLGHATSFNIKTLVENGTLPSNIDYTKLSLDNFIIGVLPGSSNAYGFIGNVEYTIRYQYTYCSASKAYNANTGVLTCGVSGSYTGIDDQVHHRNANGSCALAANFLDVYLII